jgi:TRAP-type mannitol/chloroaromatic compound transport system substrate-binding protein
VFNINEIFKKKEAFMYRKIVFAAVMLLSLSVIMMAVTANVSQAAAEKMTIEVITAWPKTTFMTQNFMRFMDNVNAKAAKLYPGQFEIKYKGGPEVIAFNEQVEAVRTGLVDMVFTATSYYTSIIPIGDGFSATAFKPWEEREKGVFDFMQKIHAEKANAYLRGLMI